MDLIATIIGYLFVGLVSLYLIGVFIALILYPFQKHNHNLKEWFD